MRISFFFNDDKYYEFNKQFKSEAIIINLTNIINLTQLTNEYICLFRNFFNNQTFYHFLFRIKNKTRSLFCYKI